MTMPGYPAPVEAKVKASAGGGFAGTVVGLLLAYLATKFYNGEKPPDAVAELLTLLVTSAFAAFGSFAAGYRAKHTPRPDLMPAPAPGVPPVV